MAQATTVVERWIRRDPRRGLVTRALDAAGFVVQKVYEVPGTERSWGLFLRLPAAVAEVFGTRREVLLWGSFEDRPGAEQIRSALRVLEEFTPQLSSDVVVFVAGEGAAHDEIAEAVQSTDIAVVVLSERQL